VKQIESAEISSWLTASGATRVKVIHEAASLLLAEYFRKWIHLIPVELHRLSATMRSEIVRSTTLNGEALLLPIKDGFKILVNAKSVVARYRASVAHELAHTMFYSNELGSVPARLIPYSKEEEFFCFEVARHILSPREHLESVGVFAEHDPTAIFNILTHKLQLSRPWASKVMLSDHALVKGIAGRWKRTEEGWMQQYGTSSASPDLDKKDRKQLRTAVTEYLNHDTGFPSSTEPIIIKETSGEGIFVLLVKN
jgi:hypothetical protein